MQFDFRGEDKSQAYRLLASVVVPRPIALVTTVGPDGTVNAAPYSFFNLLGSSPPVVALGIANRSSGHAQGHARQHRADRRVRGQPGRRGHRRGHERLRH